MSPNPAFQGTVHPAELHLCSAPEPETLGVWIIVVSLGEEESMSNPIPAGQARARHPRRRVHGPRSL